MQSRLLDRFKALLDLAPAGLFHGEGGGRDQHQGQGAENDE